MVPSWDSSPDLIARLHQRDEAALAELFSAHRDRLWGMVEFRLDERLRTRPWPDDVREDAHLAARRRISRVAEDGFESPFVWLRPKATLRIPLASGASIIRGWAPFPPRIAATVLRPVTCRSFQSEASLVWRGHYRLEHTDPFVPGRMKKSMKPQKSHVFTLDLFHDLKYSSYQVSVGSPMRHVTWLWLVQSATVGGKENPFTRECVVRVDVREEETGVQGYLEQNMGRKGARGNGAARQTTCFGIT